MTEIQQQHIAALRQAVEDHFSADSSGHDWPHVQRVWRLAARLAQAEGADQYVTQLAALAHDLEDHKLDATPRIKDWLERIGVEQSVIDTVYEICAAVSFKGALVPDAMPSLEGRCVQDADRLDALGAIGIARTFAFGGSRGRALYDPSDGGTLHDNFEAYKNKSTGSLNHFFEKLLLLKDRMHTPSALQIAEERHAYLEGFVQRFLSEWDALD